jgi:hypothetical protein
VYDREADPRPTLPLHPLEDAPHLGPHRGTGLDPVQPLPGIQEGVGGGRRVGGEGRGRGGRPRGGEQVLVGQEPETEHALHHLPPEPEGLPDVGVVRGVVVRELGPDAPALAAPEVAGAIAPPVPVAPSGPPTAPKTDGPTSPPDGQTEALLHLVHREVVLELAKHAFHGPDVEVQVVVRVRHRVQEALDVVGGQFPLPPLHLQLPRRPPFHPGLPHRFRPPPLSPPRTHVPGGQEHPRVL